MVLTNKLVNIADAIRAKTGKEEKFTLSQMATEIEDIISSPDGADVAFGSTDATQSGSYAIPSEIMNAIVAEIQKMSGKNNPLTPEEILYWLRRVAYIPQGWIESLLSIPKTSFCSVTTAILPEILNGSTTPSVFTINSIYSHAIGILQEE